MTKIDKIEMRVGASKYLFERVSGPHGRGVAFQGEKDGRYLGEVVFYPNGKSEHLETPSTLTFIPARHRRELERVFCFALFGFLEESSD